ncbi:class 1 fructose-bisphosphatase [Halovenus sp. WSH3]|uniref:Fructose-1,6-bisphosphatase class 1 n=1 Tax=Halovenus carboxidivorans TaxID=2692199 RepID=A0A6B0SYI3_9EURY|nr:class 1 fructose-bisphosphatase [Halovenus carboxidivorans]MXR50828.1 class 1 fructose-bisphosphatase [Halovenus carboxidivorans]
MDEIDAVFETVAETAGDVRSILGERRSYEEGQNPSGEQQLAADIYADERLEQRLLDIPAVGSYASEERDEVVEDSGEYHVACDPLDGSSNLKPNNGMGTIVGVYDEPLPAGGDALVAAAYVLYGPTTTMVTAVDGTVTEYLVEDGDRAVLDEDVTVPDDPVVYGFGGRAPDWPEAFASFVEEIENRRLKLRYGGAMVADVNQVLTYGGLFGYPMLADRPEGKLRLQFEGHPIAAIVSMAGGASSDGSESLLDKTPQELHERTPLFVGNESLIDDLESAVQ